MKPTKSIDISVNKLLFSQSVLSIIYLIVYLVSGVTYIKYLVLFNIILVIVLLSLFYVNKKRVLLSTLLISSSLYFILFMTFRKIRLFFPNFGGDMEIIGFSTYFNYPQYFDLVFFVILILIPIVSYLISSKIFND